MYDVVTIGETMLRLTPPAGLRWEQADQFDMHIGGSESNTAVGLARLGHSVAWLSRLTNNSFGRKIVSSIARHGVDTQHIVWTDQDRIGVYYYEEGSPPRNNRVLYDRAGSSFSRFAAAEIPESLFLPGKSKYLHVTGISLGLGATTRQLIRQCIVAAKAADWKISLDVNYRAKLWTTAEAREACEELFGLADIIFLPIRDAKLIWQVTYDSAELSQCPGEVSAKVVQAMSQYAPAACIVMTLGELGASAWEAGTFAFAKTTAVPEIGRLGGGDAFSAGFLSGRLRGNSLQGALRWGNAAAQLKYSIPGDIPFFELSEVEAIVNQSATGQPFR
jgi:2-dehydro-3-deoxygluconokinase